MDNEFMLPQDYENAREMVKEIIQENLSLKKAVDSLRDEVKRLQEETNYYFELSKFFAGETKYIRKLIEETGVKPDLMKEKEAQLFENSLN